MATVWRRIAAPCIPVLAVAVGLLTVSPSIAGAQTGVVVELFEDPFVCDGGLRPIGSVSGLQPNESVEISSPQLSGVFSRRVADSNGEIVLQWRCDSPSTWTITVVGVGSGESGTFGIVGVDTASPGPTSEPVPPTSTPEPPAATPTPEPPAPTPTPTPEPATPEPPAPTPEPPAATPESATPESPAQTPTPEPATPEPPAPPPTPTPTPIDDDDSTPSSPDTGGPVSPTQDGDTNWLLWAVIALIGLALAAVAGLVGQRVMRRRDELWY